MKEYWEFTLFSKINLSSCLRHLLSLMSLPAGLEWVANSGIRPLLVSMALAGPNSQAMIDAIAEAHQRSSLVVVAAGNSDADACNTSPANAPNVS